MNDPWSLVLALVTGILLGVIFFGGLWWTVKKGVSSPHPVLWFFSSLLLRVALVLAGFYFIGRGHFDRLILCFLGFMIARFVVNWWILKSGDNKIRPAKEADHAH